MILGVICGILVVILVGLIGCIAMAIKGFYRVEQYQKMLVFKWGEYVETRGAGLHFVIPFMNEVIRIDMRTTPTNIPKQKTLTKDNIPVGVDAVLFYRVIDPVTAYLKVKSFSKAMALASPPILRNAIGTVSLNDLLEKREEIATKIYADLRKITDDWGIEVLNVEIKDIAVSKELEDAIMRVASAERERYARSQLSMAEEEIASILLRASKKYEQDPVALQLRAMNMLYEMAMNGKATTIFIPTDSPLQMNSPIGAMGTVGKINGCSEGDEL